MSAAATEPASRRDGARCLDRAGAAQTFHTVARRLFVTSVIVSAGCGDTHTVHLATELRIAERDSAGIHITDVLGFDTSGMPVWALNDTADLRVGTADGDAPYLLSRVAGAWRLENGVIAVADGQSREFRLFADNGSFLTSLGGEGAGPGEFRHWKAFSALSDSRVAAFDPTLNRVSFIDFGSATVEVPVQAGSSEACPDMAVQRDWQCEVYGALPSGALLVQRTRRRRQSFQTNRLMFFDGPLHYIGLVGSSGHTVIDSVLGTPTVRFVGEASGFDVPLWASEQIFAVQGHVALGADRIVTATSDRFEFRIYDASGHLRQVMRVAQSATPVTKALLHLHRVRADSARVGETAAEYLNSVDPRGQVPYFSAILLDRANRIWVQDYNVPQTLGGRSVTTWTVFQSNGYPLARITLPRRDRILEIGQDYVLSLEQDSLGVESVSLRRILPMTDYRTASWRGVVRVLDDTAVPTDECNGAPPASPGTNPCTVAVRKAFELRAPHGDARFQPHWTSVAVYPDGHVVTSSRLHPSLLLKWRQDGHLTKTRDLAEIFAQIGPRRGHPRLLVDLRGRLHVGWYDAWAVLDQNLELERLVRTPSVAVNRGSVHVTDNGWYLSTAPVSGGRPGYWFHLSDSAGTVRRSFAEGGPDMKGYPPLHVPARLSTYGGGDTFLVLPPSGSATGYRIEEWSLSGSLVRTIVRDVEWGRTAPLQTDPLRRRLPSYHGFHLDVSGRVWIAARVRDPRWEPVANRDEARRRASELYDMRFEVIDLASGALLSSGLIDEVPSDEGTDVPPLVLFAPRTNLGFRPAPDGARLRKLEFFELRLLPPIRT